MTTNDLIDSSLAMRIPRTPLAVRPITRASFSSKRIALPLEANSITSCSPLVIRADTSLSPSSSPIAMRPLERILANCDSSTRFTVPLAVAKNTKRLSISSDKFGIGRIVVTISSASRPMMLTNGRPRAPRLAIGTSKPLKLNTRPLSVKHNTVAWVDVTTRWSITSSSFMAVADLPLPPRFWAT